MVGSDGQGKGQLADGTGNEIDCFLGIGETFLADANEIAAGSQVREHEATRSVGGDDECSTGGEALGGDVRTADGSAGRIGHGAGQMGGRLGQHAKNRR